MQEITKLKTNNIRNVISTESLLSNSLSLTVLDGACLRVFILKNKC